MHFTILIMALGAGRFAFTILNTGRFAAIPHQWRLLAAIMCGAVVFVTFFLKSKSNEKIFKRLEKDLEETLSGEEEPPANQLNKPLSGFVGLESNGLTNQTFLICIAPEALYGWRVKKTLSRPAPLYYLPYLYMLDSEAMRDIDGIRELAQEEGGFTLSRSSIVSVAFNNKQKWSMPAVLHSGRVIITTADGKEREFLILGTESSESVQAKILHTSAPVIDPAGTPLPYTAYPSRRDAGIIALFLALGIPVMFWALYTIGNAWGSLLLAVTGLALMLLVLNAVLSRTIFTESTIEWVNLLGRKRSIPYDSIQWFDAPLSDGSLRLMLPDDADFVLTHRGETLRTILTILARKTDKLPSSLG